MLKSRYMYNKLHSINSNRIIHNTHECVRHFIELDINYKVNFQIITVSILNYTLINNNFINVVF